MILKSRPIRAWSMEKESIDDGENHEYDKEQE